MQIATSDLSVCLNFVLSCFLKERQAKYKIELFVIIQAIILKLKVKGTLSKPFVLKVKVQTVRCDRVTDQKCKMALWQIGCVLVPD